MTYTKADPKPVPREKPTRWGIGRKSGDDRTAKRKAARELAPLAFPKPERKVGTSYSRRPRDLDRMGWTKRQPCRARHMRGAGRCNGPVEAAHTHDGPRVGFRKGPDKRVIPLCRRHHRVEGFDNYAGPFKGWTFERRQRWVAEQLVELDAEFAADRGAPA